MGWLAGDAATGSPKATVPPGGGSSQTAHPDDPVTDVAERMRTSQADAIAVATANKVIGVVTLRDLTNVEVLLDRLENEMS